MRYFINILLLFCLPAAAQTRLDLKKDFGARGDGKRDDTEAFLKASRKINELKKNVVLFIPKGTYLVKPQIENASSEGAPLLARNVMSIVDCSNIAIRGEKGSYIKYASGLYYGAFRREGKGVKKLDQITTDYRYWVSVGHGFYLQNCRNISIQSLELDGNNSQFQLGGEFGDVGYQIDNDGLLVNHVIGLSLTNLYVHHFGRDGMQLINKTEKGFNTSSQNILLMKCRFDYNGRQGLSWTGGVGLRAVGCSFSYTGRGKFKSPPGAGVDFEPNAGYIVKDGLFQNCSFTGNAGVAVLADEGGFMARQVRFQNCLIQGESNHALWIKSPEFSFLDCTINGSYYFGCPAQTVEEGTKFFRCRFTDTATLSTSQGYLVESNGTRFMRFVDCVFKGTQKPFIYVASDRSPSEARTHFTNCTFINSIKPGSSGAQSGSFTTGVSFLGNTLFSSKGPLRLSWNIERSWFNGSGKNRETTIGSGFSLGSFEAVVIGGQGESVKLNVADGGGFLMNNTADLTIEAGSQLIIRKGGTFWFGAGNLEIKGKLIAEAGAFLCIHQNARLSAESLKNIVLNGKVNFSDNPSIKFGLTGCRQIE